MMVRCGVGIGNEGVGAGEGVSADVRDAAAAGVESEGGGDVGWATGSGWWSCVCSRMGS